MYILKGQPIKYTTMGSLDIERLIKEHEQIVAEARRLHREGKVISFEKFVKKQ